MGISDLVAIVTLSEHELFVCGTKTALKQGLFIYAQEQRVALQEVTDSDLPRLALPSSIEFAHQMDVLKLKQFLPDGRTVDLGGEVSVNVLPNWAIENGHTIQIRIGDPNQARIVALQPSVELPPDNRPRVLEALVASHRCDGALVVEFASKIGRVVETHKIAFDRSYFGGENAVGYQKIFLPVPSSTEELSVTMKIEYTGYIKDYDNEFDPFVFIANAKISHKTDSQLPIKPRQRVFGATSAETWYRGIVPLFTQGMNAPIELSVGKERVPVFEPDKNSVTLVSDFGHTLVLRSQKSDVFLLYVNGKPAQEIEILSENTDVRLPSGCLLGEIVEVSIRDLSGCQMFLTLPVLAPRALTPHDVMARESRAPFPTNLTVRANHRYQALRAHLQTPIAGMDTASLARAVETLDCTYETLKLRPIVFPEVSEPLVSVIIPAHNKVQVTYYGLCALLVAHNKASFEVIVVDDASTDETAELENIVSGIRVIHNTEAQRFIRACNAGVAEARGKFVVLLNNDTEPTVGWLDALVDAFARLDNVGLAGSKLLYPDGKLQEAGGIIWGTGNPWNYGNRANPWEPRFCYARQADYLSGAAMMTTRKIWDEVGGLSSYLEPMYFEDTDFAFKVREAGYKTWFVPSSIVYHFEGMTSGTDVSSGFKRYQEVNRPKFKRRWARDYANFGKEGQTPDLEKDRGIVGRVLFIDYATPREDRDAGSYAARREIELVQSLGYKVTFLPQNLAHLGSYTAELQNSGVEVITAPFAMSLTEFLEKRAAEFDAFYITRYYVAQDTIRHIRTHAPKARILFNNADLHFLRELRAAISQDDPSRLAAMRHVRDQELEMMKAADVVLSYNEVEHAVIASHTDGQVPVMTCPWVVDIPASVPPLSQRRGLSFLGSFKHHPNAEGVTWFCRSVLPLLEGSGAHLTIYGAGMDDAIKALARDTVDPVGFVEDVAEAYDRHRIFVAPLLSGAGIKGKVLSAIAHGIPTVLTPVAAEGIGLRHGHDCLIAETPEDWARAILRLMEDDALWTAMSEAARRYAAERFSFAEGRAKMKAAFEAVDLFGAV